MDIRFDDQGDRLAVGFSHLAKHVFEFGSLLRREFRVSCFALPEFRYFARLALILHDQKIVASTWGFRQPKHHGRTRRSGCFDWLLQLIQHFTNAAVFLARDDHVALFQRTGLNQQGRHGPSALFKAGLDDEPLGWPHVHRSEIHELGLQQD